MNRRAPAAGEAIFEYFIVAVGLTAFVTLATLSRIAHARVIERSLNEVGSLTEQLRDMAERDPLTGLFNLRVFHELATRAIEHARTEGGEVSLVVADLDNFKLLNDSYGHQFGDDVLRRTAAVFAAGGGEHAAVARLGGDEFAILLPGASREQAVAVAHQIERALADAPESGQAASGSFGIGVFPRDGDTVQTLFAAADGRMYGEKHRRKAESLSSLAGAARKLFVRAGRAMRPDQTTAQVLQEIASAAREEFSLTVCAIGIDERAHHPRLIVAAAASERLRERCLESVGTDSLKARALGGALPREAWLIETAIPDESGTGGVLMLAGLPTESFRPDAPVVVALAELVHAAVASGRAQLDALRAGRERDIHIDLAHALAGGGSLEERLATVTELIALAVGAVSVSIEGLTPGPQRLSYNVASGLPEGLAARWRQARTSDQGRAFVQAIAGEAPCVLHDPAGDPRLPEFERRLLAGAGIRTSAICPIRFDGEMLAILGAVSGIDGFFTTEVLAVLMNIAEHLAPAINVALLRDELEASYAQLEQASRESLARLADAAEARDPHTAGHLRRIRFYSVELARQLGLPEAEAQSIGAASTVHDLGKLSLPDEVLMKPGKLTPEDWDQIREHPGQGERLIGDSPKFETERAVARWHHERWDGTGYPDGLRGEDIPLAARIVAVADAFDALTTERPYKRAWSVDEAFEEVHRMRGTLFCPRVTDALTALWRSGRLALIFDEVELREDGHEPLRAAA